MLKLPGSRQTLRTMPTTKVDVRGLSVEVPALLDECMNYIFTNGLVEGVFRVSGSARRMKDVAENYSLYHDWLYSSEKLPSAHDVCGIVKKYLRDYLDSMNGLFSSRVLSEIRQEYVSYTHKTDEFSGSSFKSANTSAGSSYSLLSVMELDADITAIDPENLIDTIAQCLMVNNLEWKNLFFVYWLSLMKRLSTHQDQTKMSISNLSIIFQPYLFHDTTLDDLPKFRAVLTILVENFDTFVDKFVYYEEIIGGLHTLDHDAMSLSPSGSLTASPLTVYSSSQGSLPKATGESRRKTSISNRLSMFWDSYNIPVNRPKRMSFLSAKSNDRFTSSENLGIDNYFSIPVKEKRQPDGIPTVQEPSKLSPAITGSRKGDYFSSPNAEFQTPQLPSLVSKRNKRKSFFEYFRSSLSLNSQENLSSGVPTSPLTPNSFGLGMLKHLLNDSIDDLAISGGQTPTFPEGNRLLSRGFSLRFKKKST